MPIINNYKVFGVKEGKNDMAEKVLYEDHALHVKMFGGFDMTYLGKSLLGKKSGESQFVYMMQILLHSKEKGVSREVLEEILFGDRDIENVHHAMQSVVYNAKKKLEKMGLPKTNYIRMEKGNFYWTDDIPVVEDAAVFDELYVKAETEENKEEKLDLYLDACHQYGGEFLATQTSVLWVASEARRYKNQFTLCVEKAAEMLREHQDYLQMEALGKYAMAISPFSDWECITMEALVGMGRYDEASNLYSKTVDVYFEERGLKPSKRLLEMLNNLGEQVEHQYDVLDNIQNSLNEDRESVKGGYLCSFPVFQGIYRMVYRMMERGGQSVYLMLCTIVDSKGNPMRDGEKLDELSGRLGDAICHSIRHGDAVNRYGKGQYLVLLVNITRENCEIVSKRINRNFLTGRQRTGVQYTVNRVVYEPF